VATESDPAGGDGPAAAATDPGEIATARVTPPPSNPLITAVALFLVALAFRPPIVAIGPLLPAIRVDLDIDFSVAGLLTTIPVLCFGLVAPAGPWLAHRLGPRNAVATCIVITMTFSILRTIASDAAVILLLTVGLGGGIGMVAPLLSMVVRLRAPSRPGLATGASGAGWVVGSSLSALLAIPLAGPELDWRRSLFLLTLAGLFSLASWLLLLRPDQAHERMGNRPRGLPWRNPLAWVLAAVWGLQTIVFYGTVTWLPSVYVEHGWDIAATGALVATVSLSSIIGTLGATILSDRVGSRRSQLLGIGVLCLIGVLGVIYVRDLGFVWAVFLGIFTGAVLPLNLVLPVDVADRPGEIGAVAALMLLGGYLLAAGGPAFLGLIRDLTGDFDGVLWALVGTAIAYGVACWLLSPARLRRGVRSAEAAAA
jgi:CP family cyanate transporter-like MFS transporter